MKEAGEFAREGAVHVINKGIEEAGGGGLGDEVVVGDGGGDEGGVAGGEVDGVAGGTDAKGAVAGETHGNDEGVVFAEVAVEGFGDFHDADIEIGGVDDLYGAVGWGDVFRAVVGLDVEVEGLGGEGCMEFAGTTVHAWAVVVVDAVGDVGGLLDLCEEDAAANGVDAAGGEVEDVAGLDLVVGEDVGDRAGGYALLVFGGGDFLLETGVEVGAGFGVDDVPHFGFAHLAVEALGHRVVGVDLNAEVTLGIDEFCKQRELGVEAGGNGFAEDCFGVGLYYRWEGLALPGAVGDDAGARGNGGDFPAFANRIIRWRKAFVGAEVCAAPDNGVEVWGKEQRVELHCIVFFQHRGLGEHGGTQREFLR